MRTIVILAVISLSFASPIDVFKYAETPPGTILIEEGLYADELEVSNLAYREYLHYLGLVYGKENSVYKLALPSFNVQIDSKNGDITARSYFEDRQFDHYPVVGVTWQQASAFAQWRSDRVYEMWLVRKRIIDLNTDVSPQNIFTVEKYITGRFRNYDNPDLSIPVPLYALPTRAQWSVMAGDSENGTSESTSFMGYDLKKKQARAAYASASEQSNFFGKKSSIDDVLKLQAVQAALPNELGLYNVCGNVSEIMKDGKIKGCSYSDAFEDCNQDWSADFSEPQGNVGFRNVCTLKSASSLLHLN